MSKNIVIIGGGKHAYSVLDLLTLNGHEGSILGYVDQQKTNLNLPYLGSDRELGDEKKFPRTDTPLVMGIGIDTKLRGKLFEVFKKQGFSFMTLAHPAAVVNPTATLGEGSVVFAGAVIGPGVELGRNVVAHTLSALEHRAAVGDHSYVSPGAIVCGECRLGQRNFLGVRATLVEDLILADDVTVGAGAVVLKSCETPGATLVGLPAKEMVKV